MAARWTDSDIARLRRLAGDGMTAAEIAEALGRSVSAVQQRLWRHAIGLSSPRARMTAAGRGEAIRRMAADGMTARQIAEDTGLAVQSVYAIARWRGIRLPRRPGSAGRPRQHRPPPLRWGWLALPAIAAALAVFLAAPPLVAAYIAISALAAAALAALAGLAVCAAVRIFLLR